MNIAADVTQVTPNQGQQTAAGWAPKKAKLTRKVLLIAAAGSVLTVAVAGWAWDYWATGRFIESTDDAYVGADSTTVAPKVSGYIKDVLVGDNEAVKAGQVLARIDDADYRNSLTQAEANVAAAKADVAALQADITRQAAVIDSAHATITADRANATFAEQDRQRYADLVKTGYGTVQRAQSTDAGVRAANAQVTRGEAALTAALRQKDTMAAQLMKAEAELKRDEALAAQAALNLGYATITAAVDGTVGARSLRVGQYVQAGTQLMQVVPLHAVYVKANFKETQLTRMYEGQPATVTVDAFPGVKFKAHIDSLAPASGQEFALLPPDNATGNFTKVVQRVPVKIALELDSPQAESALAGRLRPGMSVEARVNTKDITTATNKVAAR